MGRFSGRIADGGASSRAAVGAALAAAAALGCGGGAGGAVAASTRGAVVYGADDRAELFEVAVAERRALMEQSMVAFIPRAAIHAAPQAGEVVRLDAPTWGERARLCAGERFAAQPAAAFCTGVLVDWDLVLTAGHCLRLYALDDFAIVFGYAYTAPDTLGVVGDDLRFPRAIVDEALDAPGAEPRLDHAWVRLDRKAAPPRRPALVHNRRPPLASGDPLVSIGASGGTPLKLDGHGRVADTRESVADYFVAATDTTAGSSGGGAFDTQLALTGVLARGQLDLMVTDAGCNVTARAPEDASAAEEFTYAHRALESLCARDATASSLCRPGCGDPCQALEPAPAPAGGCAIGGQAGVPSSTVAILLMAVTATAAIRRRAKASLSTPPMVVTGPTLMR